jgi:hypothetical protein
MDNNRNLEEHCSEISSECLQTVNLYGGLDGAY